MFTVEQLNELKENLTEHYDFAIANEWEVPITLSDDIDLAITAIEELIDLKKRGTEECRNTLESYI